jgi:hypothetical protein
VVRFLVGAAIAVVAAATPARADVTVYLDRHGDDAVSEFGGGTHPWRAMVACVRQHFAPFAVEVVDRRPPRGHYITAVIGGRPGQLGMARGVDGDAPYRGKVMRDATVHVFSRAIGEHHIRELCDTTAHEIGHALGLDHVVACHDLMSSSDRCAAREFLDVEARCGEHHARDCDDGAPTQSSYRRLGALVGWRHED